MSVVPQSAGRRHLRGLDGLRAVSILLVVLSHFRFTPQFAHRPLADALSFGTYGVTIFFVISGYLITRLLVEEEESTGEIALADFYRRRAFRILPAALVYLSVIAAIFVARGEHLTFASFGAPALFVRNLMTTGTPLTEHYWSLSIEEQFYCVWPVALVLLPKRFRATATITLWALVPLWRQINYWHYGASNLNSWRADFRCDALLAGAAAALLAKEKWARGIGRAARPFGPLLLWSAIGLLAVTLAVEERLPKLLTVPVSSSQILLVVTIIVVLAEGCGGEWSKVFDVGPVRWLGRLSYSLYVWQQPFFFSGDERMTKFPLNVILALGCACGSYYLVERPMLRLRDSTARRTAPSPRA